jgi:multidrug efflux pump subunit AcrB
MSAGWNLSALAVRERSVTLFFLLLTACIGAFSLLTLGRAEDPAFTVRVAVVSALWPGASAREMQDQVADRLERSLQGVDYFYKLETISRPGRVDLVLELQDYSPREEVQQLWDQVRKRMHDEAPFLPEGVLGPFVNDEFSDVYFTLYALTAEGLPQRRLVREAERLRDELTRVAGVKKVRVIGERAQRVYVELDQDRLMNLGITPPDVLDALQAQSLPAGLIESKAAHLWREADLVDLDAIRAVPIRAGARAAPGRSRRCAATRTAVPGRAAGRGAARRDARRRERPRPRPAPGEASPIDARRRSSASSAHGRGDLARGEPVQLKFAVASSGVCGFLSLGLRRAIVGVAVPLTLGITFMMLVRRQPDCISPARCHRARPARRRRDHRDRDGCQ